MKRNAIQPDAAVSIRHQCDLLGLARASYSYRRAGEPKDNLTIMRILDEVYTEAPFYGSRKMVVALAGHGHVVNRKRVQRLMRLMGLEAIYAKPRLSQRGKENRIYPYLLRDVPILRPNQVWSTDITYIPMRQGFLYLVAVIDWHSRYVLAWRLSNTLATDFCVAAVRDALEQGRPEIFNTDQGCQFTSREFTSVLTEAGISISMDGRRRCSRAARSSG